MKDFFQFRETWSSSHHAVRIGSGGGINSGGGTGHSDGQSDSGSERKGQDKDYENLGDVYDFEDETIRKELINLYGYNPKIANKTLMRNNPDIKRIDSRGNITYR